MFSLPSARAFVDKLLAGHRALEALASLLCRRTERGECVDAVVALVELHCRMARHDGFEESVLFPALAEWLPTLGERVTWARRQHQSAEEILLAIEVALLDGEGALATRRAGDLHALLVGNHTTEELVLYGCVDEILANHAETQLTEENPSDPVVWSHMRVAAESRASLARWR